MADEAVLTGQAMLKYTLPAALLALSAAALAVPGGPIDVLPPAAFVCELPGDATGAAGYRVDAENFEVVDSTSYQTPAGRGTYLLTGDALVLTSGPKRGDKYRRLSDNFLRKLGPDGKDSNLRCVRMVLNNAVGPGCTDLATGQKRAICQTEPLQPPKN